MCTLASVGSHGVSCWCSCLVPPAETEADERGEVYSWGSGQYGRLGHGNLHDRFLPLRISSPLDSVDAVHVACGEFHSAVVSGKSSVCVLSNVATAGAPAVDGYIGNETMWLVEQGAECLKGIGVVIS